MRRLPGTWTWRGAWRRVDRCKRCGEAFDFAMCDTCPHCGASEGSYVDSDRSAERRVARFVLWLVPVDSWVEEQ